MSTNYPYPDDPIPHGSRPGGPAFDRAEQSKQDAEAGQPYREKVADALHSGAEKAKEWSDKGPDATTRPLRSTGEGLEQAAEYLGSHDLNDVYEDVVFWAKQNPGTALAAAAAAGFCLGLALNSAHRPDRGSRRYER